MKNINTPILLFVTGLLIAIQLITQKADQKKAVVGITSIVAQAERLQITDSENKIYRYGRGIIHERHLNSTLFSRLY